MIGVYLSVSAVLFGLLFLIWTKKDLPNFMIKAMFFGMFVLGTINALKTYGVV